MIESWRAELTLWGTAEEKHLWEGFFPKSSGMRMKAEDATITHWLLISKYFPYFPGSSHCSSRVAPVCPEGGEHHCANNWHHNVSSSESIYIPRRTERCRLCGSPRTAQNAGPCSWPQWSQSLCLWKVLLRTGQKGTFQKGDFCYLPEKPSLS